MSMSDDNASEDNLDVTELYTDVYMRGHLMEKEIEEVKKASATCKEDIEK